MSEQIHADHRLFGPFESPTPALPDGMDRANALFRLLPYDLSRSSPRSGNLLRHLRLFQDSCRVAVGSNPPG